MIQFADISRQYDALLSSDVDGQILDQYSKEVAAAKLRVTEICSEFATN
jgi:hypothetical protein